MCNVLCFSGKPSLFVWGREIKKHKNIVISSLSSDSCKRRRSQQEEEGSNETNYGFYFYRCLQTKSLRRMFNWGHWRRWRHSTLQKISRTRDFSAKIFLCIVEITFCSSVGRVLSLVRHCAWKRNKRWNKTSLTIFNSWKKHCKMQARSLSCLAFESLESLWRPSLWFRLPLKSFLLLKLLLSLYVNW